MVTRAKLVEIFVRAITLNRSGSGRNYYANGVNDDYPSLMDGVINNSPTAMGAVGVLSKYIAGKGVKRDDIVNRKKNLYLSDIVGAIAEDIARQNGSFIWVGYSYSENGDPVPSSLDVLDYARCRIEEVDDNKNPAKIIYSDFEEVKGRTVKSIYSNKGKKKTKYYPFNPNKEIVGSQIIADGGIENYRGQVFYLNLTPRYKYALSKFDPVFNDMDSEFRFGLYVNTQMRKGWTGKTIILAQGLDEETEEQVQKDISKLLGAENSGNAYFLSVDYADNLEDILIIKQVKAQFDDKLSEVSQKQIRTNILSAANNLPPQLVFSGEGALFGASGDALEQYKLFYNEQTFEERAKIEKTLKRLGFETEIIPFTEGVKTGRETEEETEGGSDE